MALLRLKKLYRAAGLPLDSRRAARPPDRHARLRRARAGRARRGAAGRAPPRDRAAAAARCTTSTARTPTCSTRSSPALPPLSVTRARRGRAARARGPAARRRSASSRTAPPEAMPTGARRMSAGEILLWIIFPYVAIATFVVGTLVALPHRPVRLDERLDAAASSSKILGWAGPGVPLRRARRRRRPRHRPDDPEVVHRGGRHVRAAPTAGSPRSPAPSPARSASSASSGSSTGGPPTSRVRRTTSRTDLLVYFLLVVLIGLGLLDDVRPQPAHRARPTTTATRSRRGGARCSSCSPTSRPSQDANTVYQVHAIDRVGVLGAVPVQPPRARLEHPAAVPRPPVHPLPAPLRDDVQPSAMSVSRTTRAAPEPSSRSRRSRSPSASTPGACSARSAPTSRTHLGLSDFQTSAMVAVPVLLGSLMRIPLGWLTDRLRRPARVHRADGASRRCR